MKICHPKRVQVSCPVTSLSVPHIVSTSTSIVVVYLVLTSDFEARSFHHFETYGLSAKVNANVNFHFYFFDKVAEGIVNRFCKLHDCTFLNFKGCPLSQALLDISRKTVFGHLIIISNEMRGPFTPRYVHSTDWAESLARSTTADLVVTSLECPSSMIPRYASPSVIVISHQLFLTANASGLFTCNSEQTALLQNNLVKFAVNSGFNVSVLSIPTWIYRNRGSFIPFSPYNVAMCKEIRAASIATPFSTIFVSNELANGIFHKYAGRNDPPLHSSNQADLRQRTAVIYVYHEKNEIYIDNIQFFFREGVRYDENVDYIFVVNGDTTISFPTHPNVKVIRRPNSCLDIGTWGPLVLRLKEHYRYFIILNTSIRGPYLPTYWDKRKHWVTGFTHLIDDDIKLVGLSVNCPDGVSRPLVHIQSMLLAFDSTAIDVWSRANILKCVDSREEGYYQEADLTISILNASYNIAVMQSIVGHQNWRLYRGKLEPRNSFTACTDIELDIFYKRGWYSNTTPHPSEFMFIKVNRDIYLPSEMAVISTQENKGKMHLIMFAHWLVSDGAPVWLFEVAAIYRKANIDITLVSPQDGPLRKRFQEIGVKVVIFDPLDLKNPVSVERWFENVARKVQGAFNGVLIFNTILWLNAIKVARQKFVSSRLMWIIHESELDKENANDGFHFGLYFPNMHSPDVWTLADIVIFVSHATRAIVSRHDYGNFKTIHGFANVDTSLAKSRHLVRRKLGFDSETTIITTVGTVCPRKRQDWTIRAFVSFMSKIKPVPDAKLLIIGWPNNTDIPGDYVGNLSALIPYKLRSNVVRIPFTDRDQVLRYVSAANLHVSASSHESFPLNILEAMFLGVSVLSTPVYGVVEQILSDKYGFLTGESFDSFQSLFLQALTNTTALKTTGLAGKALALKRFSPKSARPALLNILKSEIEENQSLVIMPAPKTCIIMRTFAGQVSQSVYSLEGAINSILAFENPNWELIITQTDDIDFNSIFTILSLINDPRIRFVRHNGLISSKTHSFEIFHRMVYHATDSAIKQCSQDSRFLLVTNGDNTYAPSFLNHLDESVDIIAYDFYTRRYAALEEERAKVGGDCERLFTSSYAPCKQNLLRHWHTDLGANVMNLIRWRCEDRRYVFFESFDGSQDGLMLNQLIRDGWTFKHVRVEEAGCLFDHNPNAHSCIAGGSQFYWDDVSLLCVSKIEMQSLIDSGIRKIYKNYTSKSNKFTGRCLYK